ncbi:MAG: CpaE family protein [Rhodospirillales bacterium]
MGERLPFMAFVLDDSTRATLVRVAENQGWSDGEVLDGGVREAIDSLAGVSTPQVLVIDLSDSSDPLTDIGALAEVCDAGTRVIAVGNINDVNLFRTLVTLGVQDYLLKPVTADALNALLVKAAEEPAMAEPEEARLGRLIAVIGARGGVGASTIAVNTAWLMAHEQKLRVAVVDLDLYFGTVALSLDLEPGRGFREALENPNRIDGLFIERALVRESDNLFILGAEEALENDFSFDPAAVELLLEKLRRDFDCIIVDFPRAVVTANAYILSAASAVAVVSDASLAGMRDTLRLVAFTKRVTPAAAVKVVVNRVGAAKKGELSKEDFEHGAGLKIDHVIPQEAGVAAISAGVGKPLVEVAKRSRLVTALRKLSSELSAVEDEPAKAPFWQRFLKQSA